MLILFFADCREEPFVDLRLYALAFADSEDGNAGRDGSSLFSDGKFPVSRLSGCVNYLHDFFLESLGLC